MSVYPHDWIPGEDFPALLRCARCPAEAALALDVPRRARPPRVFEKRLVWRSGPGASWATASEPCPVPAQRRGPHRAPAAELLEEPAIARRRR